MYGLVQVQETCNLGCKHCSQIAKRYRKEDVKINNFYYNIIKRIDFLNTAGVEKIELTGGEATLNPFIFDIGKYINYLNIPYSIVTNGLPFTKEIQKKIFKNGLLEANFSMYHFRDKEYNEFVQTKNAFKRFNLNFYNALSLFPKVGLYIPLGKYNIDFIDDLFEWLKGKKIHAIKFIQVMDQGRAKENNLNGLNSEEFENFLEKIKKFRKIIPDTIVKVSVNGFNSANYAKSDQKNCWMDLEKSITIDFNGYLYSCCLLMNRGVKESLLNTKNILNPNEIPSVVKFWNNTNILNKYSNNKGLLEKCIAIDDYSFSKTKFVCPLKYLAL